MKHFLILHTFFLAFLTNAFGQSYLGYISKATELIDTNRTIVKHLPKGDAVFLISLELQEGYYNIVHIKSNKEGFIPRKDVVIERVIPQTEGNVFTSIKTSDVKDPIIKVFNNSKYAMTVKINDVLYELQAKEKRAIHLKNGRLYYRVSSQYIEPYYGTEIIENFHLYEWEFYIADL
jgi:hypothetical protein